MSRAAVYRATAVGAGPLSFATVESDPEAVNPTRRKETVKPRGWVAQDLGNLVCALEVTGRDQNTLHPFFNNVL